MPLFPKNTNKAVKPAPTAFKMRSGNGPLQFKQMGATPVKQLESEMTREELTKKQEYNKLQKDIASTPGTKAYEKEQERIKQEKTDAETAKTKADADAKAKVDATRGTERGQVKKQGKLDKIQARQDKKALKKFNKNQRGSYKEYKESVGEGEGTLSKKDWKAQNKGNATSMEDFKSSKGYTDKSTRREERLKKEVDMTPEEYKANQADKKQKFQDAMNRTAMILHPNFDPSQVAEFDEGVRRRGQAEETERINNEYKAAETKRIESSLDAYKKKKAEGDQLFKDESNTVNKDGSANMEKTGD